MANQIVIRVGLPKSTGQFPCLVTDLEQPALLSAGSLWDPERRYFRDPGDALLDVDCALDSSGFVRQRQGGYPWDVPDYVNLAGRWSWTWWATMDLPCEPELAGSRKLLRERQEQTVRLLQRCRLQAQTWRNRGAFWLQDPVPILQGWRPDDYAHCAALIEGRWGCLDRSGWPKLVGVGSMCRRRLTGPEGILAVLERLDQVLPKAVGLHLFGVKGAALRHLADLPRVVSIDSQAWGEAARREAYAEGVPCSMARKKEALLRWLRVQRAACLGPARTVENVRLLRQDGLQPAEIAEVMDLRVGRVRDLLAA